MAKSAYINFRTDPELKEKAEKIYAEFGMPLGDAFNLFLRQSVIVGGYPFELRLPGYFDEEDVQAEEKQAADIPKNAPRKKEIEKSELVSRKTILGNDDDIDDEEEDDMEELSSDSDDDEEFYRGYEELEPSNPRAESIYAQLRKQGLLPEGDLPANKRVLLRGNEVMVEENINIPIPGSSAQSMEKSETPEQEAPVRKVGRNDPCPCGSGKKYKRCHGR